MRAYPASREWLTLLIRRMDAVASVYRLAASMSPGIDGLRSRVEFHRRGRFDATITLHDGRSFGIVRQGLALRRRSLYDRLRAIAGYDYTRCPSAVLILTPSVWEERLTTRFCERLNLDDYYVAVETRDALERRDLRLWHKHSWVGMLMFSDSVLPNWPAKMSDHGDINVDAERTGKTSGAQQPAGRAYDYGPGGDSNGSEHTPHQAHPGGLP